MFADLNWKQQAVLGLLIVFAIALLAYQYTSGSFGGTWPNFWGMIALDAAIVGVGASVGFLVIRALE